MSRRVHAVRHVIADTPHVRDDAERSIADYERMGAIYADDAETHPVNASYERPAILALAGELRGRRVLDVGCAAGALAGRLADAGAEVVGVDVNPVLVVLRADGALVLSTHHPTVDIHAVDPPAPYFEPVLLTDTWHKAGGAFEDRYGHRPLSAVVDALADAGFVIERIAEPLPDPGAFSAYPELFAKMARGPWFLFVRAAKR